MIQSKRLIPIMIATTLVFSSFSATAQTEEELFQKAISTYNEAIGLMETKYDETFGITTQKSPKQFAQGEALLEESYELFKEAAKKGHPRAEYVLWDTKLWVSFRYSHLSVPDCFKFKPLVIELSKQDVHVEAKARALLQLANFSEKGQCAREDGLKALELYGQACDLGLGIACDRYSIIKSSREMLGKFQ